MEYHKQPQEPGIPMHLLGTAQRETLAGFWQEVSVFKKSQAVIQKGGELKLLVVHTSQLLINSYLDQKRLCLLEPDPGERLCQFPIDWMPWFLTCLAHVKRCTFTPWLPTAYQINPNHDLTLYLPRFDISKTSLLNQFPAKINIVCLYVCMKMICAIQTKTVTSGAYFSFNRVNIC